MKPSATRTGNIHISDVNLGEILKGRGAAPAQGLRPEGADQREEHRLRAALRRSDPYDMEYARDLGYCAAKLLLSGGNAAMVRWRPATSWPSRSRG
jgi:6-phosphofructokinase 1